LLSQPLTVNREKATKNMLAPFIFNFRDLIAWLWDAKFFFPFFFLVFSLLRFCFNSYFKVAKFTNVQFYSHLPIGLLSKRIKAIDNVFFRLGGPAENCWNSPNSVLYY
jgi:hypothetical protein